MNPFDFSRRRFLAHSGFGLGSIALASLLNEGRTAEIASEANDPLAPRKPHRKPRAKHVIYLHMIGAPSQLDLFNYKPELVERDGQVCPEELTRGKRFAFIG